MKVSVINRIKQLQAALIESGVARTVLALPAPRFLALPAPTSEEIREDIIFAKLIEEKEIVDVCRDLYVSGFYNQAVAEAFKALDKFVQSRVDDLEKSGTFLMDHAFSPSNPILVWSERASTSQKDEQKGYHRIYSASMLGLRNPCSHEHNWIDDPVEALECIALAQHLLRKAKGARLHKSALNRRPSS